MKAVLDKQPASVQTSFPKLMIDSRDDMVLLVTAIRRSNVIGVVISNGSCDTDCQVGQAVEFNGDHFSDMIGTITLSN